MIMLQLSSRKQLFVKFSKLMQTLLISSRNASIISYQSNSYEIQTYFQF